MFELFNVFSTNREAIVTKDKVVSYIIVYVVSTLDDINEIINGDIKILGINISPFSLFKLMIYLVHREKSLIVRLLFFQPVYSHVST